MDKNKKVIVIGTGVMGRQIAMLSAIKGYRVTLLSRSEEHVVSAKNWVRDYLAGRIKKGRISEVEASLIKERYCVQINNESALGEADIIIESIIENIEEKIKLFKEINKYAGRETIIATNSSNICSSRLMEYIDNPKRLMNIHFLNPALVMELVEICGGEHTDSMYLEEAAEFIRSLDKYPIVLRREIDGFVVNRINAAITHEACNLVEKDIVSFEDVDIACEKGLRIPMGPFRLMDLVGLDVHCDTRNDRYKRSGNENDAPSKIVLEKVEKGELGRKTHKGFYDYPKEERS